MRGSAVITTGALHTDHIAALEGLRSPVTVQRRCADLPELLAAAQLTHADAVLIIGDTAQLTDSVLAELQGAGLTVVAISDRPGERHRLVRLGIEALDDGVAPEVLANALQRGTTPLSAAGQSHPEAAPEATIDEQFEFMVHANQLQDESGPHQQSAAEEPSAPSPGGAAGVTAVWGTQGAPGRSTVAVNLAAELALAGRSVLLIDADTTAASVAVQLGLIEESAGIAQACRAAELGRLDHGALDRAITEVEVGPARLPVLTGLPRSERWPELRQRSLSRVLELAGSQYDYVIVDIAAPIDQDEELAFDSHLPQRSTATRTVLAQADRILALGTADPVGFSRLARSVDQLRSAEPAAAAVHLVINQLRKEPVGRSPRRQLTEAWAQLGMTPELRTFLPWDRQGCDAALRHGQVLAEAAADSPLRRQLAELISVETGPPRRGRASARARRRRRAETPGKSA